MALHFGTRIAGNAMYAGIGYVPCSGSRNEAVLIFLFALIAMTIIRLRSLPAQHVMVH